MTKTEKQLHKLLEPLFIDSDEMLIPASEELITVFQKQTLKRNIPDTVIEQLIEFYKVTNGVPCLNSFDFHRCDDEILFEWWESDIVLWLGQRDCDILRWSNGKFCLGDASDVSYSEEYEFSTLIELLEIAFEEWYSDTDD